MERILSSISDSAPLKVRYFSNNILPYLKRVSQLRELGLDEIQLTSNRDQPWKAQLSLIQRQTLGYSRFENCRFNYKYFAGNSSMY